MSYGDSEAELEDARLAEERIRAYTASRSPQLKADLLRENIELRANGARLREALALASETMNYMGDKANDMDIVEDEDIAKTKKAFELVAKVLAETPDDSLEVIRAEEGEAYSKLLEYAEFVSLENGFYVCDECGKQHPYCDFDFIAQLRNECKAIRALGDGGEAKNA